MPSPGTIQADGRDVAKTLQLALAAIIVALLLVRYLLVPEIWTDQPADFATITVSLTDSLIAAALAALGLAIVAALLRREPPTVPQISVLGPGAIRPGLNQSLDTTTSWRFSGTTGNWCCSEALPVIARRTLDRNRNASATLILLDPMNQGALDEYTRYRQSLFSSKDDPDWTTQRVRKEILATVVRQYSLQADYPHLRIRVFLKPASSILRYDEADDRIFVTREDLRESALLCDKDTFFYEAIRRDLDYLEKQAQELPKVKRAPLLKDISRESTRSVLEQATLLCPEIDNESSLDQIAQAARQTP